MTATLADPVPTDRLDPATAVGPIVLATRDRDRLAAWYGTALGLRDVARDETATVLGAEDGTPLVVLADAPGAERPSRREPGLYHVAVLMPSRAALGRWLRHAVESGIRLHGAADHLVSEAIYLADPEGNGIEIYRDRDRPEWPMRDGRIHMENAPLDADGILAAGDAAGRWTGAPAGTVVGHVHLKIADLPKARRFYVDTLGFDATEEGFPSALFVSAGGYHHHLGMNAWESEGGVRTPGRTGLKAAVVTTTAAAIEAAAGRLAAAGIPAVRGGGRLAADDPAGNRIVLVPGPVDAATALALAAA